MPYLVAYYDDTDQQTYYMPECCYFSAYRTAKTLKERGFNIVEIYERKEAL